MFAIHVELTAVSALRDDAFSDNLSQKADSEASSGPLLEEKSSSKNDLPSPCEQSPDYFGGVMGRWMQFEGTLFRSEQF